jgi:hypothetical protein
MNPSADTTLPTDIHTETYREYDITLTPTSDEDFTYHLRANPPEGMEGWYDDAEIEESSLAEAIEIAHQSVDTNYQLYEWKIAI